MAPIVCHRGISSPSCPSGLCPKGLVHMSVPPLTARKKNHFRARYFKVFAEGCFFAHPAAEMLSTNKSFVSSNLLSGVAISNAIIVVVILTRNARVIAVASKSRVRRGFRISLGLPFKLVVSPGS